jgi:uncharacterized protein YggT (Ycf19 family)
MHVYLTIMMQVQLVNWSHPATRTHPLLALGHSLVPPLLRPFWLVLLQIRPLLTAPLLLTVLCL